MDTLTAGLLLGVAPYTIVGLDLSDDGWTATVRDMATHGTTRRLVPGTAPVEQAAAEPEADPPAAPAAPAKKAAKKAAPKAAG